MVFLGLFFKKMNIKKTIQTYSLPLIISASLAFQACENTADNLIIQKISLEEKVKAKEIIHKEIKLANINYETFLNSFKEEIKNKDVDNKSMKQLFQFLKVSKYQYDKANEIANTYDLNTIKIPDEIKEQYDVFNKTINKLDFGKSEVEKYYFKQGIKDVKFFNEYNEKGENAIKYGSIFTIVGIIYLAGMIAGAPDYDKKWDDDN